jgi:hypothetical protein
MSLALNAGLSNRLRFDPRVANSLLSKLRSSDRKVGELDEMFGGFSRPSKMPGLSYNLPALVTCPVGSVLRNQSNTVCSNCYALKGRYVFPNTVRAMQRRLDCLLRDTNLAAAAIARRLELHRTKRDRFFRWHDSGDVVNADHMQMICWTAEQVPSYKFWLPTREARTARIFAVKKAFPANLCVRLSAARIGQLQFTHTWTENTMLRFSSVDLHAPDGSYRAWSHGSLVQCHAPSNDGKCGSCRACWDNSVNVVNYKLH